VEKQFFPYQRITGEFKISYWLDFLLVVTYLGAFLILLAYAGSNLAHTSPAELIFLGFIIPMFYSSFMIGISVYLQHTHESIPWFRSRVESKKLGKQEKVTMHVRFPHWYNLLSHNVMEHTAHHIDPRIPLYNLPKAQKVLTKLLGEKMVTVSFSLQGFLQTMAGCKLYDYENHRWLDFDGNPTSKKTLVTDRIRYANAA
jgi:Fatty acid desaturase